MYLYPTSKYTWIYAIFIVPIFIGSFLLYKMFAVPDAEFSIVNTLKKHALIVIGSGVWGCLSYYLQCKTISTANIAFISCLMPLSIIILERSIYE